VSGPRIGELFTGYGGIGLGVKEVWPDATVAWVSDVCKFDKNGNASHYDPHRGPCRVLAHRHPDAPNLGDITKIDWSQVEPVDIITGGSPCQDLSHAGKRAGMKAGTRSGLWASMCDAIDILRPSLVIWENVRGALSAEATIGDVESCEFCVGDADRPSMRALGRVLGDLADIGYDAAWVGLRAADVGACHGRFRVFVLAWPADAASVGLKWTRGARARRHGPADGSGGALVPTPSVADATGGHASRSGARSGELMLPGLVRSLPTPQAHDAVKGKTAAQVTAMRARGHGVANLNEMVENLLPTPAVNDMGEGKTVAAWDDWTSSMKSRHGNGNGHGKSLSIETQRLLPTPAAQEPGYSGPLVDSDGNSVEHVAQRTFDPITGRMVQTGLSQVANLNVWGDYAPAIARHERALGRPAPAHLEPTGKDGAERLAPRFVEWMMGLPDGWITDVPGVTRTEALKLCGNGVVPQQCAEAVRWLLDVRTNSTTPTLKETHK